MTKTLRAVVLISALQLLGRGTDYITGDPFTRSSIETMEVTPYVWGVTSVATALLIIFGALRGMPYLTAWGLLVGFSVYTMFGVTVIEHTVLATPVDDWRLLTDHWANALTFLVLAVSLWYRHGVHMILLKREEGHGVD